METFGSSYIAGIGAHLPKTKVSSDDLMAEVNCTRFGISENYISRHIGIEELRVAEPGQEPSHLATLASESALRDAGVTADEIDLLVYTGITRDCEEPSTAHFVQTQLGATNAFCMDVSNACLGFMTGLSIADTYISSGAAKTVMVCTGECQSNTMKEFLGLLKTTQNKEQFKKTFGVLTVGDAGGAMVIRSSCATDAGWKWLKFHSNGAKARLCYLKLSTSGVEGEMIMQEISSEVVGMHAAQLQHTYESTNWSPNSIDRLYCHQVGKRPHKQLAQLAEIELDRAPITYRYFGNLTSASIPVNMYLSRPERGKRLLFFGSGSGLTICQAAMIF